MKNYREDNHSQAAIEDEKIATRRLSMYSGKALEIGVSIDQLYINHSAFKEALAALDRIFQLSTRVQMPHGMRLIGPSGVGKSTLLEYFQQSLPRSSLFTEGLGAVYVRIPTNVTLLYLMREMLKIYRYAFLRVTYENRHARMDVLLDAIRQKGTRLLMLDEAQNLTAASSTAKRDAEKGTAPTDLIRELIDKTRIGVVLSGTRALEDIDGLDNALASRVVGRHSFEPFNFDATWIALIKGFEAQSRDFDLKILLHEDVILLLHKATHGYLRSLKRLITEMVLVAADSGARSLERRHLSRAYDLIYGGALQKGNPFDAIAA